MAGVPQHIESHQVSFILTCSSRPSTHSHCQSSLSPCPLELLLPRQSQQSPQSLLVIIRSSSKLPRGLGNLRRRQAVRGANLRGDFYLPDGKRTALDLRLQSERAMHESRTFSQPLVCPAQSDIQKVQGFLTGKQDNHLIYQQWLLRVAILNDHRDIMAYCHDTIPSGCVLMLKPRLPTVVGSSQARTSLRYTQSAVIKSNAGTDLLLRRVSQVDETVTSIGIEILDDWISTHNGFINLTPAPRHSVEGGLHFRKAPRIQTLE